MPFTAVLMGTDDGRICGYVQGVLNTTVYAATEEECIAGLKAALRKSWQRAYRESLDCFSGLRLRYIATVPLP